MSRPSVRACRSLLAGALLLAAGAAAADLPKRVLLLHSFGRDYAPFGTVGSAFRAELARIAALEPLVVQEASLDAERSAAQQDEGLLADFLVRRHGAVPPDLLVAVNVPALQFFQRQRGRLFPGTPLLAIGVEHRTLRGLALGPRDRVVAHQLDLVQTVNDILQLVPETRTVAVVAGSSALEQYWLRQIRADVAHLSPRVELVPITDVTLDELRSRVSALPPGTAVLYGLFTVDRQGVLQEGDRALRHVRAGASAPLFGVFEGELGDGVVGGRMLDARRGGVLAAPVALAMLRGEDAGPQVKVIDVQVTAYDWRELRRWGIAESRLPAGAEVRFRPPPVWQEHRGLLLGVAGALLLQAALITVLLAQRARRRAEGEAAALSGRLLTAHEDERKRLARELHDDLTQRLARLAIDAGRIERRGGATEGVAAMRHDLVRLSEDVHALSYRLHPSVLDDLGLLEALRAECDRVSRDAALPVEVDAGEVPAALRADASLCLYRVAQEALSNAVRHAAPSAISVRVARSRGGLQLAVSDNGAGFDPKRPGSASLGLASMRERVRLLRGELDIESTPGRGTTVVAWVPA